MMGRERILKVFELLKLRAIDKFDNINLSDRDRKLLMFIGGFIVVLIIYLVVFSFGSTVDRLEKKALKLEMEVLEVKELKAEYMRSSTVLKKLFKGASKRKMPLISEVEKILLNENIERKNFSIKDRQIRTNDEEEIYDERAVDVEIKNVPMNKMIDILYSIQTRPSNLKISGLRLRTKFDNSNSIDIYFQVSTFEFKEVA